MIELRSQAGRSVPGTIFASQSRIIDCTSGSLWIASSATRWRASAACLLRRAGLSTTAPISMAILTPWPSAASAACSRSRLFGLVERFALDAQQPLVDVARHQLRLQREFARERAISLGRDHLRHRRVPEVALFARRIGGVLDNACAHVARTGRRLARAPAWRPHWRRRRCASRCGGRVAPRCVRAGGPGRQGDGREAARRWPAVLTATAAHGPSGRNARSTARACRCDAPPRAPHATRGARRVAALEPRHSRGRASFRVFFSASGRAGRLEGQQPQQHHRERRVFVRRQAQFAAAMQAQAVEQLRFVRRHAAPRAAPSRPRRGRARAARLGARRHGLQHRHAPAARWSFPPGWTRRTSHRDASASEVSTTVLPSPCASASIRRNTWPRSTLPSIWRTPRLQQLAVAEGDRLVGQRQRIAHRAARRARDEAQRLRLGRHRLRSAAPA